MEYTINYRAITITALQTAALFAAGFIPVIGQLAALFTPVPIIVAYARHGRQVGLSALMLAGVLISLLAGWLSALILLISFGIMAVGISEGMIRRLQPEWPALLGGLLPPAIIGSALIAYLIRLGQHPITALEAYLRTSIAEAVNVYTRLGLTEIAATVGAVTEPFVYYLARLLPGIVAVTFTAQAACCYGIGLMIIARRPGGAAADGHPTLASWHAPDSWVWGLIAALGLSALPLELPRFVGLNIAVFFGLVYLVQGIAIVEHFFRKAGIPSFARGLLHALILATPVAVFVIALGVVDIWADIRKLRPMDKSSGPT